MIDKLDKRKILRREKLRSIFPTFVFPLILGIVFFWYFTLYDIDKAIGLSLVTSLLYPVGVIVLYIKQAKLTDFSLIKSGSYYFETIGYEKMVIRFEFLERLLFWYFIFFIIAAILIGTLLYLSSFIENTNEYYEKVKALLTMWLVIPIMMVYTMLIFKVRIRQWKDFEFHYSLGCFKIAYAIGDSNKFNMLNYSLKGLKHYDSFLQKNLDLRLNAIENLVTIITISDCLARSRILEGIVSRMKKKSELNLLTFFVTLLNKENSDQLLAPYTLIDKLKNNLPFIIIIISTVGVSLQLLSIFKPS